MESNKLKSLRRLRRRRQIRKRIVGSPDRPRLSVYRSLKHTYAQLIDDLGGRTIVSASTNEGEGNRITPGGNRQAAGEVGRRIAERARAAGVSRAIFDRGGYRYQGRVKAVAEAARKLGLEL